VRLAIFIASNVHVRDPDTTFSAFALQTLIAVIAFVWHPLVAPLVVVIDGNISVISRLQNSLINFCGILQSASIYVTWGGTRD